MKRSKLISLRQEKQLTQDDVRKLLEHQDINISTSYYGMIEQGARSPSIKVGIGIAKLFGVQLEEIFLSTNTTKRCVDGGKVI